MAVPTIRSGIGTDVMPRTIAASIFEKTERASVVQQIAQEQPLTGTGVAIPVITGRPSAGWVSEAGRKPVSDMTLGTKLLDPKKLAVIVPFSKEYLRDTPANFNVLNMLRPKIAEAFAMSFDAAAIKGTSTPFSTYIYQTTNAVEVGTNAAAAGGLYSDLVAGFGTIADEGKQYRADTIVFDETFETKVLSAVDTAGRPLFVQDVINDGGPVGRIAGRPVYYSSQATTGATQQNRGFAVDSSQLAYGVAEDIVFDISREASIVLADGTTMLHLWQNNLVALLAETELAFVANDVQAAVRYADAT
jgi:HK97 family phage major capsid protein